MANIAHGLALRHAVKSADQSALFARFWDGAEKTGTLCHFPARSLRGIPPDEAYTYGLFHNCGAPLLIQRFPSYRKIMTRAAAGTDLSITKMEEDATGTSHAILGYFLARSWMLPDHLCQAILIHHEVSAFEDRDTSDSVRNLIGLGHLAEHIRQRWLDNVGDAEWAAIGPAVSNHFGLTEEDIATLLERGHAALEDEH